MVHAMRREGMENLVLTEKLTGRRSRGGQRLTFVKSLKNYIGKKMRFSEISIATKDWNRWKTIIANVLEEHGI